MLQCQCKIWLNTTKTIERQQVSLCSYYRYDSNNFADDNNINYSIKSWKSCDCKTSITEILESTNTTKNVKTVVLLKYLSNL